MRVEGSGFEVLGCRVYLEGQGDIVVRRLVTGITL